MATKTTTSQAKNADVRKLEPNRLWNHFADLNSVPRPSKQEQRVIEFVREFGESLGLETRVDQMGNVIIRKPATAGMENRIPVVLQSHLDMVHQKNRDVEFDFENQGIEMEVDGDWVRARGTTLGADNGLGVASIMTILESNDIAHPPLEALFTIDEETGMTGAKGLEEGLLHGRILLNLDTEEDHELTIGCAGGVDVTATGHYPSVPTPPDSVAFQLMVRGLTGGHSGTQIHEGLGNANKIMNRLLWNASEYFELQIAEIDGGGLRNAIPRESQARIVVSPERADELQRWFARTASAIQSEYVSTDPDLVIECKPQQPVPENVVPRETQRLLLGAIYGVHSGIFRMSPDVDDLVQTSNNLARVLVQDGEISIGCLTRSSVDSERDDLANAIKAVLQLTGATVEFGSDYPGWQPKPDSTIVRLMSSLYEELFGASAHVAACHAGLECGIIGTHYPEMQMISFGPNILAAHSPDERAQISSLQKFWKYLVEILQRIPEPV